MAEVIGYLLSGGATNTNPNSSLGGLPSSVEVKTGLNSLFSQVTKNEATSGGTRYRCIYISNNSSDDLFNVQSIVDQTAELLSSVEIGIYSENENQLISILGSPTSGTFKLKYTVTVGGVVVVQTTSDIAWNSDQLVTSDNIQQAINLLTYLSDVIVTPATVTGGYGYNVEFAGNDGKRSQNILEIVNFSVSGATSSSVVRITSGGPINQVAANVGFENQPPFDVSFSEEVDVGMMRSGDVYGIWIKRITPPSTDGSTQRVDEANLRTLYLRQI